MKQAKASEAEWQQLVDWFNGLESSGKVQMVSWRRVVFGYAMLVENCCDPTKDFLEWKPGIIVPGETKPAKPEGGA